MSVKRGVVVILSLFAETKDYCSTLFVQLSTCKWAILFVSSSFGLMDEVGFSKFKMIKSLTVMLIKVA